MSELSPSLNALAAYPQWINWHLVQKPGVVKPAKMPMDATTGGNIDPHNPGNWLTCDEAVARAALTGCGVGFVLTERDPFFFLDLDNCATEGGWSDLAQQLCGAFNGAAIEVSQSGTGLHIIGCGTVPTGFKTRNNALGIEIYSQLRFMAIGMGQPCSGDAWTDHSAALAQWVPHLFESATEVLGNAEWTSGPREGYTGPSDDDELIRIMLSSRGAAKTFGGKISVNQLWDADEAALAEFFPDIHGDRPFDHSAADAALMGHLAFWTGCDCERMDRLFRRSGLMREKYDARIDYQRRTITGAAQRCTNIYDVVKGGSSSEVVQYQGGGGVILTPEEQIEYFTNCVYISDRHRVMLPNGTIVKPEVFNVRYGGKRFIIDQEGKLVKKAFEALTENCVVGFTKVDSTCFRPDKPVGWIDNQGGVQYVNTYLPIHTEQVIGDPTPFLRHMELLFPDPTDREYIISYLAAMIQYPGVKFQWCPVIQGVDGNGKSFISRFLKFSLTTRYWHDVNTSDLGGNGLKFNAWLEGKLAVMFEEIYVRDRFEVIEALKPYITNETVEIQGKGGDQRIGDNRANFIMFTNHKDAIHKTRNDRRYGMFFTAQQSVEDLQRDTPPEYVSALYQWAIKQQGWQIMNWYLHNYEIRGGFNPAVDLLRAPNTTSTAEAIATSYGSVEQEVIEAVEAGRVGFRGGWIASDKLDDLLTEVGLNRRIPRNKRKVMLRSLGYIPHPGLPGGRSTVDFLNTKSRPILYIHESLTDVGQLVGRDAVNSYCAANLIILAA